MNESSDPKHKNACSHCGKRFANRKYLLRHEKTHSDLKMFECIDCLKQFKLKSSLQRHEIHSHKGEKNHKCTECNASFAQYTNLRTHIARLHTRKQTQNQDFACTSCSCIFTRLSSLNRHKASRHPQEIIESKQLKDDTTVEDPKQLAQLVVAQLKSLEMEISYTPSRAVIDEKTIEGKNDKHVLEEATSVDKATTAHAAIIDRLNPEGLASTINAQTVKRPRERLAFVCKHCAKEFKKPYNFIRHLRTHSKERPYKCSSCVKCFGTKSQLRAHSERMHILDEKTGFLSNRYQCCICHLNFDSVRQLDNHMSSHEPSHVVIYMCSICNAQFNTMTAVSTHKHKKEDPELNMLENLLPEPFVSTRSNRTALLNSNFQCKLCGLRLPNAEAYNKHVNHHKIAKKQKCNACGSSYTSKISLHVHKKAHSISKTFSCDECGDRDFPTKSQLQRHYLLVHENIRNVYCAYCPKTFKNKAHCKSHMKTHLRKLLKTNNQDENFSTRTPVKAKIFVEPQITSSTTSEFVEIELLPKCSKHKHRNFQINELEQKCSTPESLASVALRKTQHICSYCTKAFQKPNDLVRHVRTHTEERPFECITCRKKFKLKSTLEDHQKTHQSFLGRNKPTCQVCGKSYASSKSLSVHLRLHTGALPFKCDYCGKSFRTSGHRLSHMRAMKAENGQCRNLDSLENILM